MGGHEVDRLRVSKFRRDHQVTFVLAVFMIDQDEHLAVAGSIDDLGNRADRIFQVGLYRAGSLKAHTPFFRMFPVRR